MESSTAPMVPTQAGLVPRAQGLLTRARALTNQPALRRALPAMALVAAAALALAAYLLLSPPQRVALQNGLPEAEKARALDALTSQGIDAQLDPSSGVLTVKANEFHKARMALAAEGLPQGIPDGLSTIKDMPMGTSRSVESARLRRMQELDLARSISELQPVRSARVHLALPERSAFVRDLQPPRASVFLKIAPGTTLSPSQVRAVVSLVSTAVANMPAANVSIVDQAGRLLTSDTGDPFQMETERQLRQQMQVESLYRERIMSLITPIVGAGNAAVEVTADMDFTRSEMTSETYMPDTSALRSEQQSLTESSQPQASGIPGAVSNTPPPQPQLKSGGTGQDTTTGNTSTVQNRSSSSTRNYEVSRQVQTTHPQGAKIKHLSAAVLLRAPASTDPAKPAVLPQKIIDDVQALTKSAIGYDQARGDVITVSASAFAESTAIPGPPWYTAPWIPGTARVAVQLAILAIVVMGVVRPLLNRLLPQAPDTVATTSFGNAIEVARGETLADVRARLHGSSPDPDDLNGALSYEDKVALLRDLAESESSRIAGVLRSMIADDRKGTS